MLAKILNWMRLHLDNFNESLATRLTLRLSNNTRSTSSLLLSLGKTGPPQEIEIPGLAVYAGERRAFTGDKDAASSTTQHHGVGPEPDKSVSIIVTGIRTLRMCAIVINHLVRACVFVWVGGGNGGGT
jgi:hypothetical protein